VIKLREGARVRNNVEIRDARRSRRGQDGELEEF
jgi:hypothetical protein